MSTADPSIETKRDDAAMTEFEASEKQKKKKDNLPKLGKLSVEDRALYAQMMNVGFAIRSVDTAMALHKAPPSSKEQKELKKGLSNWHEELRQTLTEREVLP